MVLTRAERLRKTAASSKRQARAFKENASRRTIEKAVLQIRHKVEEAAENGNLKKKFTYANAPQEDEEERLAVTVDAHVSIMEQLKEDFTVVVRRLSTPDRPIQGILVKV